MQVGYSGTPLPKKLGIKPYSVVRLYEPPAGFAESIYHEAGGFVWADDAEPADVTVLFAEWESRLLALAEGAIPKLRENGSLWIGWPKRASKAPTDLTEDRLRDLFLPRGLVDVKVCAIDEKWSGLKFVRRLENRKAT